ncbi:unnamed protein product, partial [Tuber aestivum]
STYFLHGPAGIGKTFLYKILYNYFYSHRKIETFLIIWDEVPMQLKYCFEAVSHMLNDIFSIGENCLFGNILIVLGGDLAQILPMV